jgi:hypothetical protein
LSAIENKTELESFLNENDQVGDTFGKKETKTTWIQAFSNLPKAKYEEKTSPVTSDVIMHDFMTVMPLREVTEDSNTIRRDQQQPVHNRSLDQIILKQQTIDPIDFGTAASIVDGSFSSLRSMIIKPTKLSLILVIK